VKARILGSLALVLTSLLADTGGCQGTIVDPVTKDCSL